MCSRQCCCNFKSTAEQWPASILRGVHRKKLVPAFLHKAGKNTGANLAGPQFTERNVCEKEKARQGRAF